MWANPVCRLPDPTFVMKANLTRSFAFALAALLFVTSTAIAQGVYGAAEVDDDDVVFFLLGSSWSPGGLGWKPYVGVTGYNLRFPTGSGTTSRSVITPSVGVIHAMPTQSLRFGVGYAFSDEDVASPVLVGAESGDGVIGSFGWDHWGNGGHALQLLGSYNFGTEFLWTRGRAAKRLTPTSPLFVGGEAALLGDTESSTFIAQFGPTLEWRFNPQFRIGGSAGLKTGVSNVSGSAVYGRLEFLWLPAAR